MKTLAIPSGATLLASSAVVLLAGCQWVDTRPEVTITPAGDLVGSAFVELQVDAGGAPRAQILVDGRTWGAPVPTGEIVHLDLQALAKGDHELIARVELGTSPRSSQPRRLVRVLSEPDLPVGSTAESDPWKPFRVEFRADLPMTEVAVEVTGVDQVAIPFTQEIAADRRSVVVAAAGTLAGLGAVRIHFQARGPDGERGDVTVQYRMPDPIWVGVQVRSVEHVDLLFTPEVPVPGATVVVSDGAGNEMVLGEFGPSPWEIRLPDGTLGSGSRVFEFRRPDARFASAHVTVNLPPGFLACALDTVPATLAPGRCARVTNPIPLRSLQIPASNAGWATLTQVSDTEWRYCVTERSWRSRPYVSTARLDAVSMSGFPLLAPYEPVSCPFPVAWDWKDPGADPVTDGTGPIRGELLAVRASIPDAIRIAYVSAAGTADPGAIHVAARGAGAGVLDPGPAVNVAPVAGPAAALGETSAVAWQVASTGTVEALLQEVVGAAWTPWPTPAGAGEATEPPALARDASGPTAVAWAERLLDGTTRVRVRAASAGWTDLPSVAFARPGTPVRSVALAAPTPLGAGIVLAFVEEDLLAGRQYLSTLSWNGSSWDRVDLERGPGSFFPHDVEPVRVSLAGSASSLYLFLATSTYRPQVWRWDAARSPVLLAMGEGNGVPGGLHAAGAPSDGREAIVAWVAQGTGASSEIWIGPAVGTGATSTRIASVPGVVTGLALDADGMSVAWTQADGTIHVRTLTP